MEVSKELNALLRKYQISALGIIIEFHKWTRETRSEYLKGSTEG